MPINNISKYYSQFAIITLNTLLLFIALNMVAAYWLKSQKRPFPGDKKQFPKTYITDGQDHLSQLDDPENLLYQVYPNYDSAKLLDLFSKDLSMTDHPSLGVMVRPGQTEFFHVGKEGVRFSPLISEQIIDSLFRNHNAAWCLGGSTMYGHKIGGDETIPYFLNLQNNEVPFLNIGVPSYHQNLEVDKLLVLLKKGFRPKRVIFLDGNNDILSHLRMNFHPAEAPGRANTAYPQRSNIAVVNETQRRLNLTALPIVKLMRSLVQNPQITSSPGLPYEDLDDPNALYFKPNTEHYYAAKTIPCDSLAIHFPKKIYDLYQMNQQFVDKLATAYGFEYDFFFQPLGFLHEDNPFITDFEQYRQAWDCYDVLRNTQQLIRDSIAAGALPNFHDLSQADEGCDNCYIDLVHYSAPFNQKLAEMMLQKMERAEETDN